MLKHPDFQNLYIVDHPLVQDKLTRMRDRNCSSCDFRRYLKEISLLMGYDLTRELVLTKKSVETPLKKDDFPVLGASAPIIVPILRAGLGMVGGLEDLMPAADIGHIGVYRDENTKRPVEYLFRMPEPKGRLVLLVDPMLATGHSVSYAADLLNKHGVDDSHIRFMALVAAPEGVQVFQEAHPGIPVFVAALDDHLNEDAFIVPGLGDAGDRLFGTC